MNDMELLLQKIENRQAKFGILGLGYVGLPLAVEVARAGFKVVGIDTDSNKVKQLLQGNSYVRDVDSDDLNYCISNNLLRVYTDYSMLKDVDIIDIAVPTPLSKSKTPDVTYIIKAMSGIEKHFVPKKLIVLESTTYPGTTKELVINKMESSGYVLDRDYWAAFSPERVDPGNPLYQTKNTPKVIGGASVQSSKLAETFYSMIIDKTVVVNSCEEAEMCKLLENTFRAVNIGFINELAMMCDKMGIDIWNVIEAAQTKPFGFMPFYPGPGIGGHCIPLDPMYLSWKAKHFGFYNRSIELASDINENMPEFTVDKLLRIMNQRGKLLNGASVLMLGVAYKNDVDDVRESPALSIFEKLQEFGARVSYYDPYVERFVDLKGKTTERIPYLNADVLERFDVIILITAHKSFDYTFILEHANLIFDTRNAFNHLNSDKIVRL